MDEVIRVDKLSKSFTGRQTLPGVLGAIKSLFCAKSYEIPAIKDLSFTVKGGERVAFIGPNGAGKSTMIKMLTGILHPTSGLVEVLGLTPWRDRRLLGYKIGTVFGQRTQLWPSLPPTDSFYLLSKIYEIERPLFDARLRELVNLFDIEPLLQKPVRHLSLGERMRCELVASLLHNPSVLFLDEPTIGLDINAKLKIRGLLNKLSQEQGMTLFLTSHDTADIEQVCDRVLILDQGTILLDNALKELKKNFVKKKILSLTTDVERLILNVPGIKVLENRDHHFICEIDIEENTIEAVIHETLKRTSLKDVTIEDPSMEEIIRTLYKTGRHG